MGNKLENKLKYLIVRNHTFKKCESISQKSPRLRSGISYGILQMLQPEIRIDMMVGVLARDGIKRWHSLVEPSQGWGVHRCDTEGRGQIPSIILYCAMFKLINDYD